MPQFSHASTLGRNCRAFPCCPESSPSLGNDYSLPRRDKPISAGKSQSLFVSYVLRFNRALESSSLQDNRTFYRRRLVIYLIAFETLSDEVGRRDLGSDDKNVATMKIKITFVLSTKLGTNRFERYSYGFKLLPRQSGAKSNRSVRFKRDVAAIKSSVIAGA
jgi:hypothetical protein